MRKMEDINGAFLWYTVKKAFVWCVVAAVLAAGVAWWLQTKKNAPAPAQKYTLLSTVFVNRGAEDAIGREALEKKENTQEAPLANSAEMRYYELQNRKAVMADYRVMLQTEAFIKDVKRIYKEKYGTDCPTFQHISRIAVAANDNQRENSNFIRITVTSVNQQETERIMNIVLEHFLVRAKELLGFSNLEVVDPGIPVNGEDAAPESNKKLIILIAILAAGLSWGIVFFIALRKSPILSEDDLKFAIGTPALITVLRKKKAVVPASMELCCRMLLKDDSANQVIVAAPSTLAENDPELACAMATGFSALGQKTLLIDFVKSNGSAGISDFLDGKNGFEEILEKSDDSYDSIFRGATAVTTAQLNSNAFKDLVADLRLRYQTILIAVPAVVDSPMVSLLDDVTDSMVLTVQTGITGERELVLAANQLKNCKIKSFHTVRFS